MNRSTGWLVLVIGAAALGAVLFIHYSRQHRLAEQAETPPAAAQQQAPAEPQVRHPIENAQAEAASSDQPLPTLTGSDAAAKDTLQGLIGAKAFSDFIEGQDLVRHLVATVDAMSRDKVARGFIPLRPLPGHFAVSGQGDQMVMDASNSRRYAPLVMVAQSVDSAKLVGAYVHLYPLFQQAYRQMGYPQDYFNDRLVETIDDLLDAPEIQGPVKLVRPKVLYQFADPDLESRSAGQKMMVRMGLQNELQIKAKLREIRSRITGRGPSQQ